MTEVEYHACLVDPRSGQHGGPVVPIVPPDGWRGLHEPPWLCTRHLLEFSNLGWRNKKEGVNA